MSIPEFEFDMWPDGALAADPYTVYREMRDLGPVVRLSGQDILAIPRYEGVHTVLSKPDIFISGKGITFNPVSNEMIAGMTLASDGDLHDRQKRVIMRPLMPSALKALKEDIFKVADDLIARLVDRGSFDAVRDLAHYLPVLIVSNLVGLPEEGREQMLTWAAATFDAAGPMNERAKAGLAIMGEMVTYAFTEAVPGKLKAGSWGQGIFDAVERGEVTREQAPFLMLDYVGPALDTTINATSSLIWLLARNPDQWDLVRQDETLIPQAINEALRLESPIQSGTRLAIENYDFDGAVIPAGTRVAVMFASANRDERKWADADCFDVRRRNLDQLAFGFGTHSCAGMNLARLEISALLSAMVKRIDSIDVGTPVLVRNNTLRGFAELPVSVKRAV